MNVSTGQRPIPIDSGNSGGAAFAPRGLRYKNLTAVPGLTCNENLHKLLIRSLYG